MLPTQPEPTIQSLVTAGNRSDARPLRLRLRHQYQLRDFAENAALAAAIAVPLVFSVFTDRIFEAEKAGLIRVLGAAALIGTLAAWWRAPATGLRQLMGGPGSAIAIALSAVLVSEAVSTATSVAPIASIWGSYDRGQGLITTAALIALAAAAALLAARPDGPSRIANAIGLTVLPAGLYALIQRAGLDPIPWLGDVIIRVSGPAGSSTLFAAHLAVALPFTALGVAGAWKAASRLTGSHLIGSHLASPPLQDLRLAVRLLTPAVGLSALVLSGSRGPAIGLAAGAAVALLAMAARAGRRCAALAAVVAVLGGIALVVALNRSPAAFGPLVELPLVDRLSTVLDPGRSTSRVRLLLWDGSVQAIRSNSDRMLFGFGPETTELMWAPYYPSILAYDEPRGWVPDRAHSLALDTLLTNGVFGLLALLMLLGAAALACFEVLGPAETKAARSRAVASMIIGGVAFGAGAGFVDGTWGIVAPAVSLGLVAGVMVWLAEVAWRRSSADSSVISIFEQGSTAAHFGDAAFALAALGALAAHFVELQVSFAVSSTRATVFLICGALLGIAIRRAGALVGSPKGPPSSENHEVAVAVGDSMTFDGGAPLLPLIVAITLIYSFARPGLAGGGAPMAGALIAVSALGCLLALADSLADTWRMLLRLTLIACAYGAAHFLVITVLIDGPDEGVVGSAASLALYVATLLGLLVAKAARATPGPDSQVRPRRRFAFFGRNISTVSAGLIVFALALPLWILPSSADALQKEGRLAWEAPVADLRARGESGRAESLLSRAIERYRLASTLAPYQPRHAIAEAFAAGVHGDIVSERLDRAAAQAGIGVELDAPSGAGEYSPELLEGQAARWADVRDAAFELALRRIERAGRLMGPSPIPPIARARALRVWAERTHADERRAERLDAAAAAYALAIIAAPNWPEVREEAARTALLQGKPAEAVNLCSNALRVDEFYSRCHATMARAFSAADDDAAAAAQWDEYFADSRNAGDADAYRQRLRTLAVLGRTRAALDAARDVLRLAPDDARTHADLAVLLEQSGDLDAARASAETASRLAPLDAGITALVERLGESER